MNKIKMLINYKKIIREDRDRHLCMMNEVIDQLKDGNVPYETREELAETAKGLLATNAVLEETNCALSRSVGKAKGAVGGLVIGGISFGVGALVHHLITKNK